MTCLLATTEPVVGLAEAQSIATALGLDIKALRVTTGWTATSSSAAPADALLDTVVLAGARPGALPLAALSAAAALVRPGGLVALACGSQASPADLQELSSRVLLAGLAAEEVATVAAGAGGDAALAARLGLLVARKPSWSAAQARPLALRKKASGLRDASKSISKASPSVAASSLSAPGAVATAPAVPAPASAAVWSLDLGADEDEDEAVDEDALLAASEALPTLEAKRPSDAPRKPCADCTCGAAEALAAGEKRKLTLEMLEHPTSGCGSCALGDAFRCGTCPYRGLPAFELGKKIELPTDFLAVDL